MVGGCVQVQALLREQGEKQAHVVVLEGTTKENMWRSDLDEFEAAYNEWLQDEWIEANKAPGVVAGKGKKKAAPKKKAAKLSIDSDDWGPAAKKAAASKKTAGPAYGASTSKAATAKPAAGGASTSKAAGASAAAPRKKAAATTSKDLKLSDVFAKAATKKKAARPREDDEFSDSPSPVRVFLP